MKPIMVGSLVLQCAATDYGVESTPAIPGVLGVAPDGSVVTPNNTISPVVTRIGRFRQPLTAYCELPHGCKAVREHVMDLPGRPIWKEQPKGSNTITFQIAVSDDEPVRAVRTLDGVGNQRIRSS